MFSLIITIISIALVAVLALATLYYGGSAYARGQVQAQAAKVDIQTQQLMGAAQLFKAENNRWPQNLNEMVQSNFLKAIPVAQTAIAQALAAQQWTMPVEYQPVFVLEGVSPELCREVNLKAYGQRGILESMPVAQMFQCSGPNLAQLQVVAAAGPDALEAAAAAGTAGFTSSVLTTDSAAALVAGGAGWMVAPEAAEGGQEPGAPTGGESSAPGELATLTPLSFGTTEAFVSKDLSIQLANIGGAALPLDAALVEGSGFLLQDSTCGATLAAGATCQLTIRFQPLSAQAYSGQLTVGPAATRQLVELSGEGTGASVTFNGLTYLFPSASADQPTATASCASRIVNGVTGWRLPTVQELELLRNNKAAAEVELRWPGLYNATLKTSEASAGGLYYEVSLHPANNPWVYEKASSYKRSYTCVR